MINRGLRATTNLASKWIKNDIVPQWPVKREKSDPYERPMNKTDDFLMTVALCKPRHFPHWTGSMHSQDVTGSWRR